jgi:hypothetical protein
MRTTIRLNDELLRQAKEAALHSGRTLTEVIEDALRQSLSSKKSPPQRSRIRLIGSGSGWLRPGVSLDSTAELLDVMEGSDVTD